MPRSTLRLALVFVASMTLVWLAVQSSTAQAPSASRTHITIPFLANATKPDALEFEGAECEVAAGGDRMTCTFQQLFLTTSPVAPDTCLVTTNSYDRVFRRDSPTHWTSTDGPTGICGELAVVTLQDAGGMRWTMELKKEATKRDASGACGTMNVQSERFSWQNIRRSLPCRFVQPGALAP